MASIHERPAAYFAPLIDRARRPPIGTREWWMSEQLQVREYHMLAWRTRRAITWRHEILLWFRLARPDSSDAWMLALLYREGNATPGFQPAYFGDLDFKPFRYFLAPPRNADIYPFWNYRVVADTGYASVEAGEIWARTWERVVGERPSFRYRAERLRGGE